MNRKVRRLLLIPILPLWAVFGLYAVAVLVLGWFALMAACIFIPSTPRGARAARRLSGAWARTVTALWGVVVVRRGPLPDGPAMFTSNHCGWADTTILMAALRGDFLFLAMKEMERWPTFGWSMKKAEHLFVDRSGFGRGFMVRRMAEALRKGRKVMVFPEGGFVRTAGLRRFALGGYLAAAQAGVPVVPVAVRGSRGIIRSGVWIPRPGFVRVIVGEPIPTRGGGREEAERLRGLSRRLILDNCGEPDAGVGGG